MKKKGNWPKFNAHMRKILGSHDAIAVVIRRQYKLLCEGVRDVRIADSAIYSWDIARGEW